MSNKWQKALFCQFYDDFMRTLAVFCSGLHVRAQAVSYRLASRLTRFVALPGDLFFLWVRCGTSLALVGADETTSTNQSPERTYRSGVAIRRGLGTPHGVFDILFPPPPRRGGAIAPPS